MTYVAYLAAALNKIYALDGLVYCSKDGACVNGPPFIFFPFIGETHEGCGGEEEPSAEKRTHRNTRKLTNRLMIK